MLLHKCVIMKLHLDIIWKLLYEPILNIDFETLSLGRMSNNIKLLYKCRLNKKYVLNMC